MLKMYELINAEIAKHLKPLAFLLTKLSNYEIAQYMLITEISSIVEWVKNL